MPLLPNTKKLKIKSRRQKQVFKYTILDYDETYAMPKLIFKIVAIRLNVEDSYIRRLLWNIFYWVEFFNIFLAVLLESINMVQTVTDGSLMDLFLMMPCVGYLVLAMAKSYKIVNYRPVFENLVNELRDMWPLHEVTKEEHLILSKALKKLQYISKGYFWCNITLNTFFTSPPFVNIVKRLFGKDVPLILSFFYWLPFDPYQRGFYEIVLALQTWHCSITALIMLASDMLYCVLLSHITIQFDLLTIKITKMFQASVDDQLVPSYPLAANIWKQNDNMNEDSYLEYKQSVELAKIITKHRALIREVSLTLLGAIPSRRKQFYVISVGNYWQITLYNLRLSMDVENMLTFSLLLNFLNSSIIICFCGFCVVFVEKWNEMIYKLFLVTATAQIWLLCWYGQRLLDASAGISEALYNSGWYTTSNKIKKCIIIMIHRSQKRVCLTTYGFSIISLSSYSTIIKTSWSYLSLLINMYQ